MKADEAIGAEGSKEKWFTAERGNLNVKSLSAGGLEAGGPSKIGGYANA